MKKIGNTSRLVVVGFSLALMAGNAFAGKPDWVEGGQHKDSREGHDQKSYKKQKEKDHDEYRKSHSDQDYGQRSHTSERNGLYLSFGFDDRERRTIRDYYGQQQRDGKCPPGLAKKHNGCMPPGLEKKWHKGRPIDQDTRYYDIPNELRIRLPVPPINHEYVRVAGDVLLVTVGTAIVVDAIEDIFH